MSPAYALAAMLFLHVLDDFGLQGIMKDLKTKAWWRKQTADPKYAYDYVPALLCHAFSWAFMVMLPLAALQDFRPDGAFFACLVLNVAVHAWVDDMKANRLKINLVQDQLCHMAQIAATFAVCVAA